MANKKNKAKEDKNSDEAILEEARKRFMLANTAESRNRERALDDINFRNGDQWDEEDKNQRETERRPCLVVNKLEQRVDQVTGDQRMNRMSAIIRPTTVAKSHNKNFTLAQVISGIIKNIEKVSNAKSAYDTAFDHAVGHGFGFWRIVTEFTSDDSFDLDIKVKRINNSFRVYLDPAAEEVTKKDAMWGFVTSMVDKSEYPDANWDLGTGEDYMLWQDGEKVRIAEYFRRIPENQVLWLIKGKTIKVKDSKIDIRDELRDMGTEPEKEREVEGYKVEWFELSANEVFKRKDFPSQFIPLIPCYGKELNVKGETIYRGVIRHAKDPQRIYNYTRSASIEQVALAPKAPYLVAEGQLGTHQKMWETANTKNYSALIYKHVAGVPAPVRQPPPQPSAGWISESRLADEDIDASSGMYKASLGAPSNERSGKAINARKVEGDVGTFHYHDNRAMSLQHSYEILVDMIPRIYDTQRIIQIQQYDSQKGDDVGKTVEINKSITDENGDIVKMYDMALGKYGVTVDIGASYTTQRQMASESMMELIQYAPQIADKIFDILARNLDWAGADEIAERFQDDRPSKQQMTQIISEAVAKALNSEKMQIEKFKAKSHRMKVVGDILTDGDKVEVDLLELLEKAGVNDQEIHQRAVGMVKQIGEEMLMLNDQAQGQLLTSAARR